MTSIILPSNATDPSQITSEIVPTTRVNPSTGLPSGGDPLQIGDRWYKPSMGQEAYWNGALWLSTQYLVYDSTYVAPTAQSAFGANILIEESQGILLLSAAVRFTLTGTLTDTNYWTLTIVDTGGEVPNDVRDIKSGNNGETTGSILKTFTGINTYYPLSLPQSVLGLLFQRINASSGTAATFAANAKYRLVYT